MSISKIYKFCKFLIKIGSIFGLLAGPGQNGPTTCSFGLT